MTEKQILLENSKLLNNLLTKRTEYAQAKQEYINIIQDFLGDAASHIQIKFNGNKMYLSFESWCAFDDKYLLRFCNEFGFLAPIMEFKELSTLITVYKWKFIKIL